MLTMTVPIPPSAVDVVALVVHVKLVASILSDVTNNYETLLYRIISPDAIGIIDFASLSI